MIQEQKNWVVVLDKKRKMTRAASIYSYFIELRWNGK